MVLSATQMACSWDKDDNIYRAESLVPKAASDGEQIVLFQKIFETPYFCIEQDPKHFSLARLRQNNNTMHHFILLVMSIIQPLIAD